MKLNCDLGESYGIWSLGRDESVMPYIDMANIACGFHASDPDVMAVAKGMGGGFPMGACLATARAAEGMVVGTHGSTYGGGPLAMAVAGAVFDELTDPGLMANVNKVSNYLTQQFEALKDAHPDVVEDVRGKGLMQAIELVVDETAQDRTPNPAAVVALFEETKKRKLLIGKGGLNGNVVRISPALNVSAEDIKEAVATMDESFAALTSN